MHVDIPSSQVLPELEKGIIDQMKILMLAEKKKVIITELKWTAEGIRIEFEVEK